MHESESMSDDNPPTYYIQIILKEIFTFTNRSKTIESTYRKSLITQVISKKYCGIEQFML